MKQVDVLYFIEHIAREFDVACIVKCICEKRYGLSVRIASLPLEVSSVIHQYQPHIAVVPYFYAAEAPSNVQPIFKHWKDLTYLNLNCEQFFSDAGLKFRSPKDSFVRNEIYQHAWSEDFKRFLIENGVKESNIIVNGNPSYTLYLEPYRNFFPTRSDIARRHKLDNNKLWLFFPENYGWAFVEDSHIESRIIQGYNPRIAQENREFNRRSLSKVIQWFGHVARNRGIEIIVRPRPAISQHAWISEFEKELGGIPKSIHIIKEGSIREWNLASDIVVSSFSTSLLEAAVCNKPIYMLEPYTFPGWLYVDWYDLVPHITLLEEFDTICKKKPDPSSSQRAREYVMQTCLSRGDAIANIARMLYDLRQAKNAPSMYIGPRPDFTLGKAIRKALGKALTVIMTARNRIPANRAGLKFHTAYEQPRHDSFTQRDVRIRARRWGSVIKSKTVKRTEPAG